LHRFIQIGKARTNLLVKIYQTNYVVYVFNLDLLVFSAIKPMYNVVNLQYNCMHFVDNIYI